MAEARQKPILLEEIEAIDVLRSDPPAGKGVRITKELAKKWLMEDKSIICGGVVYHFAIRHLGLDVYKAFKLNTGKDAETFLLAE